MPESDRPPRVVPFDGAARGRAGSASGSPADVARRLAALERHVEQALAGSRDESDPARVLRMALDETLSAYSDVHRWVASGSGFEASPLGDLGRRLLFRLWFRVEVVGRERVPRDGRLLAVANRAGTLVPWAAFMVAEALGAPERSARPLIDRSLLGLPLLGPILAAGGARPATLAATRAVLAANETAVVLPEGPGTVGKPASLWYRVATFGRAPALRAAIETGAPILPVAAIGSEETQPTLLRVERLGRLLGLPALPLTPTPLPLPTKWTLWVGEPVDVASRFPADAARDADALRALRTQVRERLQGLVGDGLRRRAGLFL